MHKPRPHPEFRLFACMNPRGARKCYVIRVLCVAQTGSVLHSRRRDVRPRLSARPASLVLVFARSGESLPGLLQQRQRARSGAQREMTAKCCEGGRVARTGRCAHVESWTSCREEGAQGSGGSLMIAALAAPSVFTFPAFGFFGNVRCSRSSLQVFVHASRRSS